MLGPVPGSIQQRREAIARNTGGPASYDAKLHEVVATLSKGSPVERLYGIERLKISTAAIDLSRLQQGGIPFLDHHSQAGIDSILGRVTDAWVSGGALMGRIKFAATMRGQIAEGMVARGEIGAVSIGYRVTEWEVRDEDGRVIDPEHDRVAWDEDGLDFLATRWQLFEASLVGVPADGSATMRALGGRDRVNDDIKARMEARHRMVVRAGRILND